MSSCLVGCTHSIWTKPSTCMWACPRFKRRGAWCLLEEAVFFTQAVFLVNTVKVQWRVHSFSSVNDEEQYLLVYSEKYGTGWECCQCWHIEAKPSKHQCDGGGGYPSHIQPHPATSSHASPVWLRAPAAAGALLLIAQRPCVGLLELKQVILIYVPLYTQATLFWLWCNFLPTLNPRNIFCLYNCLSLHTSVNFVD